MHAKELLDQPSGTAPDFLRRCAVEQAAETALMEDGGRTASYGQLDSLIDRVAAALERDGLAPGDSIALYGAASIEYVALFLGAARAGVVAALLPLAPAPDAIARMLADSEARLVFVDDGWLSALDRAGAATRRVIIDGQGSQALESWLAPPGARPRPLVLDPAAPLNIVYSSGTTDQPKGVVQSHQMRFVQLRLGRQLGEAPRMIISTPLYATGGSISLMMALGAMGAAVLMRRFDAAGFLRLAEALRATHATLAPTQYRRMLSLPDFDAYDLSSFRMTYSMGAPSSAALKGEILARWPGGLTDTYGMTEGGGTCVLAAHDRPDKLHTGGVAAPGCEIRIVDEEDREAPVGQVGEVVGRSFMMMEGYHKQPDQTAAAEWRDAAGARFIRTGDYGALDDEGFLTIVGRKRDMIISGGFNVFPSDVETALTAHPAVEEAAVVGAPSAEWGETPWGFVALKAGTAVSAGELIRFANGRLGKIQRLAGLTLVDELPRSDLGKVLKRVLKARLAEELKG